MKNFLLLIGCMMTLMAAADDAKKLADETVTDKPVTERIAPELLRKAQQTLKAHTRHSKEALERGVQRAGIVVQESDEFPTGRITEAALNASEFRVGQQLKSAILGKAEIPVRDQFAIIGIITSSPTRANSGGGIARKDQYDLKQSHSAKLTSAGRYEVVFVMGAIRLSDHKTKVLDATQKAVTVIESD